MRKIKLFSIVILLLCGAIAISAQPGIVPGADRYVKKTDTAAGACTAAKKGFVYFSTTTNTVKSCDGTSWSSGGGITTGTTASNGTANTVLKTNGSAQVADATGVTNGVSSTQLYSTAVNGNTALALDNTTGSDPLLKLLKAGSLKATMIIDGNNQPSISGPSGYAFFDSANRYFWIRGNDFSSTDPSGQFSSIVATKPALELALAGSQSANALNVTSNGGSAGDLFKIGPTGGVTIGAGTASAAPLTFTTGTNLTTPVAGAFEFDGKVGYFSNAASQRGVINTLQYVQATSDFTLAAASGVQAVFTAADDTLTVTANTSYFIEAEFFLTTGATTHTTAVGFGGTATFTGINYWAELWSVTDGTINTTAPSTLRVAAATSTVLNATSTATGTTIRLRGIIRTSAAGTIIPQINFSANPTGTNLTKAGSYFKLTPLGTDTNTKVGPWN
jgi:hypothetical protein